MSQVERLLKNAVLRHLSEDELCAYHDNALDEVTHARLAAHLNRCLICKGRLSVMQETLAGFPREIAATDNTATTRAFLIGDAVASLASINAPDPEKAAEVRRLLSGLTDDTDGAVRQAAETALAQLSSRVQVKESPPDILKGLYEAFAVWIAQHSLRVALAGAAAAGKTQPLAGQTDDSGLRWYIVDEDYGDLVVSFGSDRLELEGVNIAVEVGSLRKEVVLEVDPVTEDQVGADVIFTARERRGLDPDAQLRIDVADRTE